MSGIVEKAKSAVGGSGKPLEHGSKLPSGILLKENSVTDGSVDLSKLSGKSESPAANV